MPINEIDNPVERCMVFDNRDHAVNHFVESVIQLLGQGRLIRAACLERDFNIDTQITEWRSYVRATNVVVIKIPSLGGMS